MLDGTPEAGCLLRSIDGNSNALFSRNFSVGVRFRKIRIVVLQHLVLIAVPQLSCKGDALPAVRAVRKRGFIFLCALVPCFIRTRRYRVGHAILRACKQFDGYGAPGSLPDSS